MLIIFWILFVALQILGIHFINLEEPFGKEIILKGIFIMVDINLFSYIIIFDFLSSNKHSFLGTNLVGKIIINLLTSGNIKIIVVKKLWILL